MRPQAVVLPILREALPAASVVSVQPDVDHRVLPMVAIRRIGGARNANLPHRYSQPVLAMTAVSATGPIEAEELYEQALDALYAAVKAQTVVAGAGYLQSLTEAQGATQAPSPYPDTWAVVGSVEIGVRQR